jgi:hypothetical protein
MCVHTNARGGAQLEFLANHILIPRGTSLTLQDLAISRARKTGGQAIPFFTGAWVRGLVRSACRVSAGTAGACRRRAGGVCPPAAACGVPGCPTHALLSLCPCA